jgi:hypothetical protein
MKIKSFPKAKGFPVLSDDILQIKVYIDTFIYPSNETEVILAPTLLCLNQSSNNLQASHTLYIPSPHLSISLQVPTFSQR